MKQISVGIKECVDKEKDTEESRLGRDEKIVIIADLHFIQPVISSQCSLKHDIAPVLMFYANSPFQD